MVQIGFDAFPLSICNGHSWDIDGTLMALMGCCDFIEILYLVICINRDFMGY